MAFDEVLFPTNISKGSSGGPNWNTDIVTVNSGHEARNQNWADPIHRYNAAFGVRTQSDLETLITFFLARQGMARAFRFKDWTDYSAANEVLVLTGAPTAQLIKTYTNGGQSYVRNITKPIASPAMTMRRAASSFTDFTVDTATGIITLTVPDITKTITGITAADPGVVTTDGAHGFSNGEFIWLHSVLGMTEVNNKLQTIANVTSTTFEIEDTSAFTAYSSAGTAEQYIQPAGDALDWSGDFDVPTRFDTDSLPATWEAFEVNTPDDISIIEVRDIA